MKLSKFFTLVLLFGTFIIATSNKAQADEKFDNPALKVIRMALWNHGLEKDVDGKGLSKKKKIDENKEKNSDSNLFPEELSIPLQRQEFPWS